MRKISREAIITVQKLTVNAHKGKLAMEMGHTADVWVGSQVTLHNDTLLGLGS